jgi:hypothetical protein
VAVPGSTGPRTEVVIGGAILVAAGIGTGLSFLAVAGGKASAADALLARMRQANLQCTRPPEPGQCQDLVALRRGSDTFHNAAVPILVAGGVAAAGTFVYALWPWFKGERAVKARPLPVARTDGGGLWLSGNF